jgi:hypothetical protein
MPDSNAYGIDPAALHAAEALAAAELAKRAGMTPAEVTTIIDLVLKYGPVVAGLISKLFHHTPKPAPAK